MLRKHLIVLAPAFFPRAAKPLVGERVAAAYERRRQTTKESGRARARPGMVGGDGIEPPTLSV